jgi:hypothetical protein
MNALFAHPCCLRIPDGDELLGNHRQHLNVDSVELVEATPRSRLGQTGEEAAHHLQYQSHSLVLFSTRSQQG